LVIEVGEVCAEYQDCAFRNLNSKRLQLDEMWSWIYCKDRNRTEEVARKKIPTLAKRVEMGYKIAADALRTYVNVIEDAFGSQADYAQLHKVYCAPLEKRLAIPRRNASVVR
jgi:hypothetical protein